MKKIVFTLFLLGCLIGYVCAQDTTWVVPPLRSGLVIKSTPIPFLFETAIPGTLTVRAEQIQFEPTPCRAKDKTFQSVFPCNNYLIRPITLPFDSIAQIRRRSYLFLLPNRLVVSKKNGDSYLFFAYRRRPIIKAYRHYTQQQTALLQQGLPK